MTERILTAAALDLGTLHGAMLSAFSDYLVPMQQTEVQFRQMLEQRGFDAGRSRVAVDAEGPLGFWYLGFDAESPGVAYVVATGVVPRARRRGVARRIFETLLPPLVGDGIRKVRLEVIDGNDGAVALYRSLGFAQRRYLACFKGTTPTTSATSGTGAPPWTVQALDRETALDVVERYADGEPSWQNSAGTLRRTTVPLLALGAFAPGDQGPPVGALLGTPGTGQIHQLAVSPEHRRQGAGSALLRGFAERIEAPLVVLNIDTEDRPTEGFYEHHLGPAFLHQFELERPLDPP
jgi:ribosomal protein S18 acetylase RimI-like enzyme